jgi:hypothetical protein
LVFNTFVDFDFLLILVSTALIIAEIVNFFVLINEVVGGKNAFFRACAGFLLVFNCLTSFLF